MTALSDRVTITGSRASTSYGEHVTVDLATGMADEERIVVADGAYGIKGAAHRAVLAAGGQTVAVLAGGLDRPYPAGHSDMLRRIGDVGLLVSEVPPGAAPTRHRFIARNRLMAALSGATVIPEAGARSGSMATVLTAREVGRGVGAVPGPVTSAASTGTNELIRQRFASLVTQPSDVIALLDADDIPKPAVTRPELGQEFGHSRPEPGASGRFTPARTRHRAGPLADQGPLLRGAAPAPSCRAGRVRHHSAHDRQCRLEIDSCSTPVCIASRLRWRHGCGPRTYRARSSD